MTAPQIGSLPLSITPVGSRVTCNPPPTDTDRDWLVLVDAGDIPQLSDELEELGWSTPDEYIPGDGHDPESSVFMSCRLDEDNLIITDSAEFHRKFLAATAVAKRLNVLAKADRVALFQAVLYGNDVDAVVTEDELDEALA